MADKVKLAINWAAACGGCDVALLDLEQGVLELAELVEFVYWPVAMDFKRADLEALDDGGVDVGLFNGAVRTSEQLEDAQLLRRKCKVLVALGSCACFGGIPGLANETDREAVLATVYDQGASTDNPDGVRPLTEHEVAAGTLSLPAFSESVSALHQVTEVDVFMPGCPPPSERLGQLVEVVRALSRGEAAPPRGTFLASDRGLCHECPRGKTRGSRTIDTFVRPDRVAADEGTCLLDQGFVCMGIATRGGCGASCVRANMACRGCFGPLPGAFDPAAEMASALAALPGPRGSWEMPVHQIVSPARSVVDPLGTFYRFSYPVSLGRGRSRDGGRERLK